MNIILSTRNPSKAEQIKKVFLGSGLNILTLIDVGIDGDATEDGVTLQENALKKALFAREHSYGKVWTMADDTGIFIHALDDKPGVMSSRWAGDVTTEEITAYTLEKLGGVSDRSATFKTVVALVSPEGKQLFFEGQVEGKILEKPKTKPQPKMPYSPIFQPNGTNLVWAEMNLEQENTISHRGKAFRKARKFLEDLK